MKILPEISINNMKVDVITTAPDWTKPFMDYPLYGVFPDDPTEARKIKVKAPKFVVRYT